MLGLAAGVATDSAVRGTVAGSVTALALIWESMERYREGRSSAVREYYSREELGASCRKVIQGLREFDCTSRINIMKASRTILFRKKLSIHIHDTIEDADEKGLVLLNGKGSAGLAAKYKAISVCNLEAGVCQLYEWPESGVPPAHEGPLKSLRLIRERSFGLTTKQQAATAKLTFIISVPIFGLELLSNEPEFTKEVVGVLNVDSRIQGVEPKYLANGKFSELITTELLALSNLASKYLSS